MNAFEYGFIASSHFYTHEAIRGLRLLRLSSNVNGLYKSALPWPLVRSRSTAFGEAIRQSLPVKNLLYSLIVINRDQDDKQSPKFKLINFRLLTNVKITNA